MSETDWVDDPNPVDGDWVDDPPSERGFLDTLASYTTAPTRAAIGAAQDGNNPLSAFSSQFGEDPSSAPSGKNIVMKAGVPDTRKLIRTAEQDRKHDEQFNPGLVATKKYEDVYAFSPADMSGTAVEVVADPLNALPIAAIVRGVGKGAKAISSAAKTADKVSDSTTQIVKVTQKQASSANAQGAAKGSATISGGGQTAEMSGELFKYKAPQNLEELRAWKPTGNPGELPGKQRLEQIEQVVPDLETKPLRYHYDMMDNPKSMKQLKLDFENLPTADAKKIAAYNQSIVDESARKIKQTVKDLSGMDPRKPSDAGNDFISTVKENYKAEKEILKPAWDKINKSGGRLSRQDSHDLMQAIGANSKAGKLIAQDETGRFFLSKNSPKTGLSSSEHKIISEVVDDLNNGITFKEIQNTRDYLRKAIDPANPGATIELLKVRSILLDQLEAMGGKHGTDVAETFKKYAKNERARESIEQIIGGKVETLDAMFAANPEKVVDKVFSNPNYAKVVAEYIGPDKMNRLVQSHIQDGIKNAFDPAKGFQPHTLRTWLRNNSEFLDSYVSPDIAQRLNALADYGFYGRRFLDEVNPSGTAASLKAMIEPGSFATKVRQQGIRSAVTNEVSQRVGAITSQRQATRSLNKSLGGKNPDTAGEVLKSYGDKLSQVPGKVGNAALKTGATAQAGRKLLDAGKGSSKIAENDRPQKGPEKWANDGFDKILEHIQDPIQKQLFKNSRLQLMDSEKGRQILIEASDLKPGSKAMDRLLLNMKRKAE